MTVNSTTSRVSYAGNGSTTAFAVPFYFLANADLTVIKTNSAGVQITLVLNTDYTVTGAGVPAGGTVTCTTAPAGGETLVIFRDPAATQLTDYQANDPFPAETHERALDKLTMLVQRAKDLVSRSFSLSDGDVSGASTQLPSPTSNNLIGWNATASGLQNVSPQTLATIVTTGTTYADQFTGNGVQTSWTLSNNPGSLSNLDVSIGGVTQLPGTDYLWTSGTTLTTTSAVPNGVKMLVRYAQALPQSYTDSGTSLFVASGAGASSRFVQAKLRESVSVKDFGAAGDGTTNDFNAIAAAITAVSAAGGGVVYFPSGTYKSNSSITLPNNVYLSGYGATISWGGGASPVITTATTGYTYNAGIEGLTINGSTTATKILELYSTYHCSFRDLTLTSTSTTNICIDMLVNTSGGTNADGNRNNVFNLFDNILQEGTCGTGVRMRGNVTVPTVVTLNTFVNFNCRGGAAVRGIDFAEWADSNYFAGITRILLPSTATGAVGVEWNTASPAANVGVYSNNFDHLAVDTFGVGSGRIGIKMNLTKLNKIGYYFQEPVAEGGDIVTTANTYGYDIVHAIGGTNSTAHKVQSQNYAAGGSYSPSYSIYTNAFTLTGTNQVSVLLADTFSSANTGTAAGLTLANQTQATAFTMAGYYGVNVTNLNKGAGSTVTVQAGVYINDLTAGTTNYAIQSVVTPGTNKWGLFLNGGARNFLGAGGVEVAAGATNMTSGFVHVPSAAGVPTGAPSNPTGNVPLYYDSTNNRLYAYNGSWRSVVLA